MQITTDYIVLMMQELSYCQKEIHTGTRCGKQCFMCREIEEDL